MVGDAIEQRAGETLDVKGLSRWSLDDVTLFGDVGMNADPLNDTIVIA